MYQVVARLLVVDMKIVLLVALLVVGLRMRAVQTACSVSMNGGLPDPQPLILTPDGSRDVFGFKLPTSEGILSFVPGEEIRLVCLGSTNSFKNIATSHKDIRVRCDSGDNFEHDGKTTNFDMFSCSEASQSVTRSTKKLCNKKKGKIVEIGFRISTNEFIKIIEVCFDEGKMNTVWSKMDLVSVIKGGEIGFDNVGANFTTSSFYAELEPEKLYRKPKVLYNIGRIIGNVQADHFLTSTHYLTKGLLSDSANFLYTSQKKASRYFINSAPQFHSFRKGPWNIIERNVRDYAHKRGVNLVVYTGTHNVTTLPDMSKVPIERDLYLSLNATKQMPVPSLYWKVIYEPLSKKGVVLVGVNNPYKQRNVLEVDKARYKVCDRMRYVSTWYICGAVAQVGGFGYCCEVDDFRNFVKSLPAFEVTDILT